MTKAECLDWLRRDRLVPVIRAASPDIARASVDALLEGGITILEITMTVPGAVDVIRQIAKDHSDRVLLGAGTVLNAEMARACIDAGAQFVVSPAFDAETTGLCQRENIVASPGALTPTEILAAWNNGADLIKIFPCDALGGASYLKSLRAPFPDIPFMPTGGVTLENLSDFLSAGATAVGVGSNLVDPNLSSNALTERARAFVARTKS